MEKSCEIMLYLSEVLYMWRTNFTLLGSVLGVCELNWQRQINRRKGTVVNTTICIGVENPENISISESVEEENNQGRLMAVMPKKKIC